MLISVVLFKLASGGFQFLTYATENYLEVQLEDFLSRDSGEGYNENITIIGERDYNNRTLIFYESDCQENIIVSYENKGKFGKHNVYNLERIVKSDNSIAMIDIYENNRKKYIILSSLNRDDFDSINIMNKSTNKILEEIDLKNISEEDFNINELNEKSVVIEYIPKSNIEIKLELNKKGLSLK